MYARSHRNTFSIRNSRLVSIHLEKTRVSLKQGTDSVEIKWKRKDDSLPGFWSKFHHIWLRDNCHCSDCYHPQTHQRLLDTLTINADLRPRSVQLYENSGSIDHDDSLAVEWEDGHRSNYPLAWLKAHSYESQGEEQQSKSALGLESGMATWGREISGAPPVVDYGRFMEDEHAWLEWSDKVEQLGFCFVDGIPLEPLYSRRVLERIGVLRNTFYGDFWDVEMTTRPADDMDYGYAHT
jgi:trimethyllysine dioxygenase